MSATQQTNKFDSIVIGAGVLGLWAARHAALEGRNVCVVEAQHIGAGASGGVLGALMGHQPDNWNRKKAFQFEALNCLEEQLNSLTDDTGIRCGYRRCGRIMPIRHERMMPQVKRWLDGATQNWRDQYPMVLLEPGDTWFANHQWPMPEFAEYGALRDGLAARCDPRQIMQALGKFAAMKTRVLEECRVSSIEAETRRVILEDGTHLIG